MTISELIDIKNHAEKDLQVTLDKGPYGITTIEECIRGFNKLADGIEHLTNDVTWRQA
jgi:hypothetical protein